MTIVLFAACGDDGDEGGMRLTLSDDSCTYEGAAAPPAGALSVDVANESAQNGGFELLRVAEGSSFDDLEAYVEEEQQRLKEGVEPLGPPAFAPIAARVEVESGEAGVLSADVMASTYALTCFNAPPPTALYVAARIDVTG